MSRGPEGPGWGETDRKEPQRTTDTEKPLLPGKRVWEGPTGLGAACTGRPQLSFVRALPAWSLSCSHQSFCSPSVPVNNCVWPTHSLASNRSEYRSSTKLTLPLHQAPLPVVLSPHPSEADAGVSVFLISQNRVMLGGCFTWNWSATFFNRHFPEDTKPSRGCLSH